MASTFESLPPEIVQKCVEFLDFDLVSGDLEAWTDPILAARFTHRYFCFHLRAESTRIMAGIWSDRWEDRAKASVFMAEINRLVPPADSDSDDHPDYLD